MVAKGSVEHYPSYLYILLCVTLYWSMKYCVWFWHFSTGFRQFNEPKILVVFLSSLLLLLLYLIRFDWFRFRFYSVITQYNWVVFASSKNECIVWLVSFNLRLFEQFQIDSIPISTRSHSLSMPYLSYKTIKCEWTEHHRAHSIFGRPTGWFKPKSKIHYTIGPHILL